MELLSSSLSDDIAAGSAWCLTRICRSTEVALGLIKQGIIKVLMERGIINAKPMTSQQSAWCLGTLIQTDAIADTMAAQGLVPVAVDHLRRVRSQNATGGDISAATYLIARLARSIKLSRALAKVGVIPPLVHALQTSEDPQVLDWSARAIGCLMRPSSNDMSKLLLEAGAAAGLARLPRVLADHEIEPLGSFAFAIQVCLLLTWGSGTRKAL
ncbi:hypothetical protein BS47DRAFT_1446891 [Hydnum rufescens UP504]|uniref:Uncharacterized protein n=1 Tax=Hydnum rufescens UP504 TaxID=1448309 RepID=A0A9P6DZC3_9AGAM|nr:hypothetical protein BS47DRAFT_1446891 [Hydnum rufescens UP504]